MTEAMQRCLNNCLSEAVGNNYPQTAKEALERGANPNLLTASEPVIFCTRSLEVLEILTNGGAIIRQQGKKSLLSILASRDENEENIKMVSFVLERSEYTNEEKYEAVLKAAAHGWLEIVKIIFVNFQELPDGGGNALNEAVRYMHIDVAEFLIISGVRILAGDDNPLFLINYDDAEGSEKITRLLVENGANVNDRDETDKTPLMKAAEEGNAAVVQLFIENGANINAHNNFGASPMALAILLGYEKIVEIFLENSVCISYYKGRSMIKLAKKSGLSKIIKKLKEHGYKK